MKNRGLSDNAFDMVNAIIMAVVTVILIFPLYFTIIASLSNPYAVYNGQVVIWVKNFTLEAYANVLENDEIWMGYFNSILNTAIVVGYSLVITIPAAYVMARRVFRGKSLLMVFYVITMYFGGGLIPSYLLIKQLGMIDTRWALIIPAGFSVYNMIIGRTFYHNNIPEELFEAAKIDGCGQFGMFFRIAVPLSGAIIAVIALYNAVGHWNAYFSALLYIDKQSLFPLQYVLRNILIENEQMEVISIDSMDAGFAESALRRRMMAEGMKYSLIFIASAPMLIIYPFVQKYFVKGVMIGALKG